MGSRRKVLVIRSFEATTEGKEVEASKAEIERLLTNTSPGDVSSAGSAYRSAAQAIERAVAALNEHAATLAKAWQGPAAAEVQKAMQLMHASGVELSGKMKMMDDALGGYAKKVPETLEKVRNIRVEVSTTEENTGGGTIGASPYLQQANAQIPQSAKTAAENAQAQRAMKELNEKIVELLNVQVPMDVSYELPPVDVPAAPPSQKTVDMNGISPTGRQTGTAGYNSGSSAGFTGVGDTGGPGSGGDGTGTRGSDGTGTGNGQNGTGTGSTGQNGTGTGSTGQNGTGQNGTGQNGTGADGTGSNGTGSNGTGHDGGGPDGTGTDPAATDPDRTTRTGPGADDGTVPSVIGRDDPRYTQAANFTPTQVTTPTAFTPATTVPTTSIPMATTSTPFVPTTATPPGVPAVLGGPNQWGEHAGNPGSQGRPANAGHAPMYPFLPMGGAGAAIGSEESTESGAHMPEDRGVWAVTTDVTEPRIG